MATTRDPYALSLDQPVEPVAWIDHVAARNILRQRGAACISERNDELRRVRLTSARPGTEKRMKSKG